MSKSSSKYGPGIRNKPIPDPGSRGQKGTVSRIRIRNTGNTIFISGTFPVTGREAGRQAATAALSNTTHGPWPPQVRKELGKEGGGGGVTCTSQCYILKKDYITGANFFSNPETSEGRRGEVESGYQCTLSVGTSEPQLCLV